MTLEEVGRKRLGTTIRDKWVVEQLIGVGGMASVYVARHKIGRREAIKILHADIAKSDQLRARFDQEALAVNSFRHPGVVEVRDVDVTEDGAPFLVMELLEGESLSERIRREPPLTEPEVLRLARDVLDVLVAAHDQHIVHRDIKPDNLFLLRDGRVKVLDFGIARMRSGLGIAPRTQAGVTLGTMAYMPAEQAKGQEIDGRADIYAVGATMFRILARRIVHDVSTDAELVMKAFSEAAPRLVTAAPNVAANVCSIVDRALAFDRDDRYPNAATMRDDIDAVLLGKPPVYASSAAPLPERAASSFSFGAASPAKNAPRDAATFVPKAKQTPLAVPDVVASPAAPVVSPSPIVGGGTLSGPAAPSVGAHGAATRVGHAPEVAPTLFAAGGLVPSMALPSGIRGAATRVGHPPDVAPTLLASGGLVPSAALPSLRRDGAPVSSIGAAQVPPSTAQHVSPPAMTMLSAPSSANPVHAPAPSAGAPVQAATTPRVSGVPAMVIVGAVAAMVILAVGIIGAVLLVRGSSASKDELDTTSATVGSEPGSGQPPASRWSKPGKRKDDKRR
ncbi:Serine/threonine protein kinase PknB [Labilithrix luteola]|uniref:Serine/threonine protein kinase PknB n=1 Tax=Labilithrix luteola TaxID=1391654 RepID=A0A0K1PN91_9BACT|nr:serine/threonine-protein kinase [Labilithrix luteola]AKU94982.1 Serine/threonine protein kinase PknB [Labilithrix luteola]